MYWIVFIVIDGFLRPKPEMLQLYNKSLIMSNIHHKFVSVQILHSRPRQTSLGILEWGGKSVIGIQTRKYSITQNKIITIQ